MWEIFNSFEEEISYDQVR